jgi:hypothetical protein
MLHKILWGVLAVATMSFTSLPCEAATLGTYGNTFNNGTSFDLTSNNSSAPYSGMYIIPGGTLTLAGITQLSADYNMFGGSFGGGAPRFGIADSSDNQVWAYWGTPLGGGSFSNPNPNGTFANTGNFADLSSSDLRFYSNGFGGLNSPNTGLTWSQLLNAVGTTTVAYVVLDLDGGWSGGDQHMLVNNFTLNGDVFATEATTPLPAALPLFTSGLGALGLLAWRRKRKATTA